MKRYVPLILLALAGCDGGERAIAIARTSTEPYRAVKPGATSEERLNVMGGHGRGGHGEAPAPQAGLPLRFATPPGWKPKADSTGMRAASFTVGGNAEADCSIVTLPGGAGGVLANVNRWRKQMGQPEIDQAALEKAPRRPILDTPAFLVEIDGAYAGMGDKPRDGFKMLGAIASVAHEGQSWLVFVKLVGPTAVIEAERKGFEGLCSSLTLDEHAGHDHAPGEGHGNEKPQAAPAGPSTRQLKYKAPDSWKQAPERDMRLVTFQIGTGTECYVAILPGHAGGSFANLNRWRQQMGQPDLTEPQIAALPKTRVFGQEVAVLEVSGTFTDMNGQARAGSALLGVVCPVEDVTVFVKMIGVEAEVKAERERFIAFCASLEKAP